VRAGSRFRGTVYEIEVENPDGSSGGVRSLRVDGDEIEGNVVPIVGGSDHVRVEVVLGVPALVASAL
jgi:cellobiose phosphorylase